MMIQVTRSIAIDDGALRESFLRASGPGGQNVNKVETAVQLRLSLDKARLPPLVRSRLEQLAGWRLTRDGEVVITSRLHRTQERNRAEAMQLMLALIRQASVLPVRRIATKPTAGSRQRRLTDKAHRGRTKRQRQSQPDDG